MGEYVEIVEVGPRDGLQNEARAIPVAEKIALIDCLSRAGFRRIEAASFVSPKWVPQMAGSAEVMAGITRVPGVKYAALTPNLRGLTDAMSAGADEVAVFASASEGFSKANINATIAESIERFTPILEAARHIDLPVRPRQSGKLRSRRPSLPQRDGWSRLMPTGMPRSTRQFA